LGNHGAGPPTKRRPGAGTLSLSCSWATAGAWTTGPRTSKRGAPPLERLGKASPVGRPYLLRPEAKVKMAGYGFLPQNVLDAWPALSSPALRVAGALSRYMDGKGACYPSQEKIAAQAGITARRVRSGLRELEARGLLQSKRRGRYSAEYRWTQDRTKTSGQEDQDRTKTSGQEDQDRTKTTAKTGRKRPPRPDDIVRSHKKKPTEETHLKKPTSGAAVDSDLSRSGGAARAQAAAPPLGGPGGGRAEQHGPPQLVRGIPLYPGEWLGNAFMRDRARDRIGKHLNIVGRWKAEQRIEAAG